MKKLILLFLLCITSLFSMEKFSSVDGKVKITYDERNWDEKSLSGIEMIVPKGAYKYAGIYITDYKNTPLQGQEIFEEIKKGIKDSKKVIGEIKIIEEKDRTWFVYKIQKDDKNYKILELITGDFFGYYRVIYEAQEETFDKFKGEATEILETVEYKK